MALNRGGRLTPENISWFHIAVINGVAGAVTAWAGAMLTGYSIPGSLSPEGLKLHPALYALLLMAGVSILSSELNNILHKLQPLPDLTEAGSKFLTENLAGVLFTVAVIAPLTEELIFRGVILDGLRETYPLRTAVFVSSLLFAAVHVQPYLMINAFVIGLILALIRLRAGSLLLCVIIHGLYNALPFLLTRVLSIHIQGYTPAETQAVEFQPWWFDLAGLALTALGAAGLRSSTASEKPGVENTMQH
jgi:membrane protease YdiL (CAAX protease family)